MPVIKYPDSSMGSTLKITRIRSAAEGLSAIPIRISPSLPGEWLAMATAVCISSSKMPTSSTGGSAKITEAHFQLDKRFFRHGALQEALNIQPGI